MAIGRYSSRGAGAKLGFTRWPSTRTVESHLDNKRCLGLDRRRAELVHQLLDGDIRLVAVSNQLSGALGGHIEVTSTRLRAELAGVHELLERRGRSEALGPTGLQRCVAERVDVETSHIGDRERTEHGKAEAEGRTDDRVDVLGRRDALFDELRCLVEQRVLQAVQNEAVCVLDAS